jgi:hypothetical protein
LAQKTSLKLLWLNWRDMLKLKKRKKQFMYIENFKTQGEKKENFVWEENEKISQEERPKRKIGEVLLSWQAPEYESYERDKKWYTVMTLALMAIIAYALFTNSPIMAITFILIGIIEYIYISREPEILNFAITEKGIVVEKEIYEFESLKSFWIFRDETWFESLSLKTKNNLMPYLHIPLAQMDPEEVQRVIAPFLREEKQEIRLADTLHRLLRL